MEMQRFTYFAHHLSGVCLYNFAVQTQSAAAAALKPRRSFPLLPKLVVSHTTDWAVLPNLELQLVLHIARWVILPASQPASYILWWSNDGGEKDRVTVYSYKTVRVKMITGKEEERSREREDQNCQLAVHFYFYFYFYFCLPTCWTEQQQDMHWQAPASRLSFVCKVFLQCHKNRTECSAVSSDAAVS